MNERQLILAEYRRKREKLLWKFIKSKGGVPWSEIHKEREKVREETRKKIARYDYQIRQEKRESMKEGAR